MGRQRGRFSGSAGCAAGAGVARWRASPGVGQSVRPSEAVVDRSLRPGLLALKMVFVVVFGGVGVVCWCMCCVPPRRAGQCRAAAASPDGGHARAGGAHTRQGGHVLSGLPVVGTQAGAGSDGAVFLTVRALVPWAQSLRARAVAVPPAVWRCGRFWCCWALLRPGQQPACASWTTTACAPSGVCWA